MSFRHQDTLECGGDSPTGMQKLTPWSGMRLMPVIPASRRWRWEEHVSKANLGYLVRLCLILKKPKLQGPRFSSQAAGQGPRMQLQEEYAEANPQPTRILRRQMAHLADRTRDTNPSELKGEVRVPDSLYKREADSMVPSVSTWFSLLHPASLHLQIHLHNTEDQKAYKEFLK